VAFGLALTLNFLRPDPVSLQFVPEISRVIEQLQDTDTSEIPTIREATLDEMQSQPEGVIVLDARAAAFYELGHIPGALSLPREEFAERYQELEGRISGATKIVVYCSDQYCDDSHFVAHVLTRLGHKEVFVFSGGWKSWELGNQ